MKRLVITNASVVTDNTILAGYSVYCADGVIEAVVPPGSDKHGVADVVLDAGGKFLLPGFIDLHIHGSYNKMIDSGTADLEALCRILPRYGVTGFLPTVTPMKEPTEDYRLLKELASASSEGTEILGFFLEGHYLQLTGAIANIPRIYDVQRVEDLLSSAAPYSCVFGVSPEVPGIEKLLPLMAKAYPAFITHTKATVEQTKKAIQAGARHATHFYNVFPYPGDKEGGVRGCGTVEAIMADPSVSVDFILDGEHVDPVVIEMALACKGHDNVSLITDANINAGLPPGRYTGIGGRPITVAYEGAPARMVDSYSDDAPPGGLVGSGLTMDRALRNAIKLLGINLPLASKMVSANPARVLGLEHVKGRIAEGYAADFVLMNDALQVVSCHIAGTQRFSS